MHGMLIGNRGTYAFIYVYCIYTRIRVGTCCGVRCLISMFEQTFFVMLWVVSGISCGSF